MTGVYIGIGIAALFLISFFAYIFISWKNWSQKQRKYAIAGIVGLVAITSSIVWFSQNVSITYTKPSELLSLIDKGEIKHGEQVKLEGEIVKGSIKKFDLGTMTEFELKDKKKKIKVRYKGVLPDNFKPDIQAVAVGSYDGNIFETEDLKTKCPSKYEAAAKKEK